MSNKRQLYLFFMAVCALSVAGGIYDSTFNNFLSETFHLSAKMRGLLEFPRETPGFLVVILAGMLCMLSVTRMAVLSTILMSAGFIGMALFGGKFGLMVIMMMLVSSGQHLLMPTGASIALSLSHEDNRGRRMGQVGAVGTAGAILGGGFVWLVFHHFGSQFRFGFICAAVVALLASGIYSTMHLPHLQQPRSRLVVRKKYSLYYALEIFAGARKQIFITFGPWVLIQVYGINASQMGLLAMAYSAVGVFFRPIAGGLMDRLGERTIMIIEGIVLAFVCIGYGYAEGLTGSLAHARYLACGCFILDNMLFALSDARALYLSRLTKSPQELNSTLAMGVSINHAASMTIPIMAGALWANYGYSRVFVAATVLAVVQASVATLVPSKRMRRELAAVEPAAEASGA